jgi:hypothetical protein
LCHRRISRSPQSFLSSGYTSLVELPGCPGSSIPQRRRSANFQVALNLGSLDVADWPIFELPRISALRRSASASSGCPDSVSAAGSMMNPRLSSNFASSACAADESSRPTGPASPAWLSTLSQSLSAFHLRLAPPMNCFDRLILHFLSDRICRPTPYRVTN